MRYTYKQLIAVIISIMIISSVGFGATFSDLGDAPWAVTYINKMADLGVISGYLGKFNPNDSLSKYAAVSTIYRTLEAAGKLEDESIAVYKAKHMDTMKSYNVPDWTGLYEAVAFCLEKEIIKPSDLRTFVIGEEHQNAMRAEVSVYLGKALNLYLDENVNTIISLSFKDANQITTASAPYVNLLVKKGIISGTPEGYFKPYDEITRAAMTKMLSDTYDLLKTTKTVKLDYKTGTIGYVLDDSDKIIVSVDGYSDSKIYTVDDVDIYKNGTKESFSALDKDQKIKLGFDDEELVRIEIVSESADVSGEIREIDDRSGYYKIEIYDENDDDDRKSFLTVNELETATLDGEEVSLSKIDDGDYAKLTLDENDHIIEIEAESKYQTYEGILKSNITFNGVPELKIQLDNDDIKTFELDDEDVDIERNDDDAEITDLVVGDYVRVKTAFNKIVDINAESLAQDELDGTIISVLIATTPMITIEDEDGDERSFKLHPSAEIEIDNDDAEYYDLRVDYEVELELDGNVITKIDADESTSKDQLSGTVTKVYTDLEIITVRNKLASTTEYVSVTYDDDTEFLDADGDDIRASRLDDGDTIFIYGFYRDSFFLAEKVILLD